MDERLRLVARLLDGDSMSEVCRDFGISRKTGYKIFNRCKDSGFEALSDRCRRPVRYANQLPPQTPRARDWVFSFSRVSGGPEIRQPIIVVTGDEFAGSTRGRIKDLAADVPMFAPYT